MGTQEGVERALNEPHVEPKRVFAMLNEGKRLKADGHDVVAGFVEPGCRVRRDQPISSAPLAWQAVSHLLDQGLSRS